MTKDKLIAIIAKAKDFDLDAWMHKNYNFTGNKEGAIDLLLQKNRYRNLLNDAGFISALETGKDGEQDV
jgi:hypothetical protein